LSPEKRITKRQMKQDSFITTALKSSEYIQNNKQYFIGALIGVLAIFLIAYYVNYSNKQNVIEAENMFGQAGIAQAIGQDTLAVGYYKDIMENYGSTIYAGKACYALGQLYFTGDNCDSLNLYFNKYLDSYGEDVLTRGAAYEGLAICAEKNGDFASAAKLYMQAAETAGSELHSPRYLMRAGSNFSLAGMAAEAVDAYRRVSDDYPRSPVASSARKLLAEVEYSLE